jgi:putative colanic acid biosynthesis acetyltransferase WcaF
VTRSQEAEGCGLRLAGSALARFFFHTVFPGSGIRARLLRLFGAQIGKDVVIRPGVKIKFPWRISVADNVWIGEDVWLDNLAEIKIGKNCVISQGAYLCTGSHDWSRSSFDLIVKPIIIDDCAWIGAKAIVGPGVTIGEGAVLSLGALATSDLDPWKIYQTRQAHFVKERIVARPTSR